MGNDQGKKYEIKLEYTEHERPDHKMMQYLASGQIPFLKPDGVVQSIWMCIPEISFPSTEGYFVRIEHDYPARIYQYKVTRIHEDLLNPPQTTQAESQTGRKPQSKWIMFIYAKLAGEDLEPMVTEQIKEIEGMLEVEPFPNKNGQVGATVASGQMAKFYSYHRQTDSTWEPRQHAVASGENPYVEVDIIKDFEKVHEMMVEFKRLGSSA